MLDDEAHKKFLKEHYLVKDQLSTAMAILAGFLYSENGMDYEEIIRLMSEVQETTHPEYWGTLREKTVKIWELEKEIERLNKQLEENP